MVQEEIIQLQKQPGSMGIFDVQNNGMAVAHIYSLMWSIGYEILLEVAKLRMHAL